MLKINKQKTKIMKKLCVFLAILPMSLFGQEKYATYDNVHIGKKYEIKISRKSDRVYTMYIEMLSLDNLSNNGGIMLDRQQHGNLILTLEEAKIKYQEWSKTAKENSITEMSKRMTYRTKAAAYWYYGSEWQFQFLIEITFNFSIIDNKYMLLVSTGKLTSSDNNYITHDGFVFTFTSAEQVDDFISVIDMTKLEQYLQKPSNSDLFKD